MPTGPAQSDEESFIRCSTTKGNIELRLIREWSPYGYDRAVQLFELGYYDNSHFFRVVPNFLVQFGIGYTTNQEILKLARTTIPDDPKHNPPIQFDSGYISYAGSGKDSRSSQLFFSYGHAASLGRETWETPIGIVSHGMDDVVRKFYSGYGDMPPWGKGPVQGKIHAGRDYIDTEFPLLDSFKTCKVERVPLKKNGADSNTNEKKSKGDDDDDDDDDDDQAAADVAAAAGGGDDVEEEKDDDDDDDDDDDAQQKAKKNEQQQQIRDVHDEAAAAAAVGDAVVVDGNVNGVVGQKLLRKAVRRVRAFKNGDVKSALNTTDDDTEPLFIGFIILFIVIMAVCIKIARPSKKVATKDS